MAAKMAVNSVAILRRSSVLMRSVTLSPPLCYSRTFLPHNPIQRVFPPCYARHSVSTLGLYTNNRPLGFSGSTSRPFDSLHLRLSALSGGGSGKGGGPTPTGGGGGSSGNQGGNNDKWSFLSWYLELLAKFPVVTKAITSAILTLFGDLVCQIVIDKASSLDYKRTFTFTFLGLVLVGPTLHFWYLYLSKLVTLPGASGAFMRLILDQFLFAPVFIGVFLSSLVALEGRPAEVIPKLQQEWFSALLANWQLWIPFQFLNFRFVPQQFQVLASNCVSLIWNVILSFKAHKEVVPK